MAISLPSSSFQVDTRAEWWNCFFQDTVFGEIVAGWGLLETPSWSIKYELFWYHLNHNKFRKFGENVKQFCYLHFEPYFFTFDVTINQLILAAAKFPELPPSFHLHFFFRKKKLHHGTPANNLNKNTTFSPEGWWKFNLKRLEIGIWMEKNRVNFCYVVHCIYRCENAV